MKKTYKVYPIGAYPGSGVVPHYSGTDSIEAWKTARSMHPSTIWRTFDDPSDFGVDALLSSWYMWDTRLSRWFPIVCMLPKELPATPPATYDP